MRGRRWRGRVLLASLGLCLAFALLESGFRAWQWLAGRMLPEEIWAVHDPELGYRLNPGHDDINPQGLRDHPVRPKDGRFRVLVLGDSVAYQGENVDDTFVGHLRRRLARERGPERIDVLNAGVRGYTNYQELLWLERYGVPLEPDLVGVAFVLNDLFRFLHAFRVEDGRIVGTSYEFTPEAVQGVDSAVYRTLRRSVFLVWLRRRLETLEGTFLLSGGEGYAFDYRPDFRTAWLDEPWADIEAQLAEMRALGRERGFGLFLVAFPFGDQYRESYLARERGYVLKPQRRLREICERLAIPYLDLYPLLDASRDLQPDKIHLTAEGRRRAGERIAEFLAGEGLLPAP